MPAKKDSSTNTSSSSLSERNSGIFSIEGNKGGLSEYKLPDGIISAESIIPASISEIMKSQFKAVGLDFDVSKLALNKDNRQNLVTLRKRVEMITNNAKLLPMFAVELKKALKAGVKLARFKADMVKSALDSQIKIDQAHVDILLAMAGYQSKRNKLQMKLERRLNAIAKQNQARARYYETTWGKEAQMIDANWEATTELALNQMENKKEASEKNKQRRLESQNWMKDVH